jgi:hypothetical protein
MARSSDHVRFIPQSGHASERPGCPLSAYRVAQRRKASLFVDDAVALTPSEKRSCPGNRQIVDGNAVASLGILLDHCRHGNLVEKSIVQK